MNAKDDAPLARNVTRLAHLDLQGGGQVCVDGNHAYVGHVGGNPAPQSNDVFVDPRGLVYLTDRNAGFDILEFRG